MFPPETARLSHAMVGLKRRLCAPDHQRLSSVLCGSVLGTGPSHSLRALELLFEATQPQTQLFSHLQVA